MAFIFHSASIVYCCWVLALFVPLPSCSLPATQSRKAAQKATDKFARWTSSEKPKLLWIDGNNVRGIGKFEWNAVELQHRVVRFCHKHKIENAVVVWDHGSVPFASSARYSFDNSSTIEENSDNAFCVDLLVLFSGLSQRADDVLVKESNHLISSAFQDESITSALKMDWNSLAFVTNDRDLNFKLRRQSTPNPPSIRLSRRKRKETAKVYDASTSAVSSSQETSTKAAGNPLFCDSTGFVELLCDLSSDYDMELRPTEKQASESIQAAKASIRECSKSQRRGYNPRREKTWERCVQAETLRRILNDQISPTPKDVDTKNLPFIESYLQELHNSRGYSIAAPRQTSESESAESQDLPFMGPSRLDKHQSRLLGRFNALVRNGEITL